MRRQVRVVAPAPGGAHAERMEPDQDVNDAPTDAPSGENLLPQPLVNRYAVPVTTLVGGAVVTEADQVVIHPVPPTWTPGDSGPAAGDDGD